MARIPRYLICVAFFLIVLSLTVFALLQPQVAQAQCTIGFGGSVILSGDGNGQHACTFQGKANQAVYYECFNCLDIQLLNAAGAPISSVALPADGMYRLVARYDYGFAALCSGQTYSGELDCEMATGRFCERDANAAFCPSTNITYTPASGSTTINLDELYVPQTGTFLVSAARITGGFIGRAAPEIGLFAVDPSTLQARFVSRLGQTQEFSLSPDGKTIALVYNDVNNPRARIALIGLDGGDPRFITPAEEINFAPSWSPDGTQIAYVGGPYANDVYVMDADGSNPRLISDEPSKVQNVRWSPDGGTLYFDSEADGKFQIYAMNADGSNRRQISSGAANWGYERPVPSPDGKLIAYAALDGRTATGLKSEIVIANADGSNPRLITDGAIRRTPIAWSSDSTQIFYVIPQAVATTGVVGQIYGLQVAGNNPMRVSAFGLPEGFNIGYNMLLAGTSSATVSVEPTTAAPDPILAALPLRTPGEIKPNETARAAVSGYEEVYWSFGSKGSEKVTITVRSSAIDPYVVLYHRPPDKLSTSVVTSLQVEDKSRKEVVLEAFLLDEGEYLIWVKDDRDNDDGEYSITLSIPGRTESITIPTPELFLPESNILQVNQTYRFETAPTDQFTAQGQAGETFTLTLEAEALDAYVGVSQGDSYLAEQTSQPGQKQMALTFTLLETGPMFITISAIGEGNRGMLTLRLTSGSASAAPTGVSALPTNTPSPLDSAATPDLVATAVAGTLQALGAAPPSGAPTETPDIVATSVAGTLAAVAPPPALPTITPYVFPTALPGFTATPLVSRADCPGAPPTIFAVGQSARIVVGDGTPANLRAEPTTRSQVVRQLPVLTAFELIDGPVCGTNSRGEAVLWWKIRLADGGIGWVVEGTYYEAVIEPLN